MKILILPHVLRSSILIFQGWYFWAWTPFILALYRILKNIQVYFKLKVHLKALHKSPQNELPSIRRQCQSITGSYIQAFHHLTKSQIKIMSSRGPCNWIGELLEMASRLASATTKRSKWSSLKPAFWSVKEVCLWFISDRRANSTWK